MLPQRTNVQQYTFDIGHRILNLATLHVLRIRGVSPDARGSETNGGVADGGEQGAKTWMADYCAVWQIEIGENAREVDLQP